MIDHFQQVFGERLEEIKARAAKIAKILRPYESSPVAELCENVPFLIELIESSRQEMQEVGELNAGLARQVHELTEERDVQHKLLLQLEARIARVNSELDHYKEVTERLRKAENGKAAFANYQANRWMKIARNAWKRELTEADVTVLDHHETRGLWPDG